MVPGTRSFSINQRYMKIKIMFRYSYAVFAISVCYHTNTIKCTFNMPYISFFKYRLIHFKDRPAAVYSRGYIYFL